VEASYAEGLQPVEFIEETTIGTTPNSERKLQQVIDSMVLGDTLIVSRLSRLARNMVEVMPVLDQLVKKGCRVHAVKGGYRPDQSLLVEDLRKCEQPNSACYRQCMKGACPGLQHLRLIRVTVVRQVKIAMKQLAE
jgi:hypothetical protein